MAKIGDASHLHLSELVNRLNLENQAGTKELRSTGTNLYVKDGKALFTNVESRASHQRDAVAVVRNALAQEYHLTPEQANRVMADVLGEPPTSITADDVMRLHGGADAAISRLARDGSSSESATLVHDLGSGRDSVGESSSQVHSRSGSISHEESDIPTAPPFDRPPTAPRSGSVSSIPIAPPLEEPQLDGPPAPPPFGPPPPPPMGRGGGTPSWKAEMETRLKDDFGSMVLQKDLGNANKPIYKNGTVPTTDVHYSVDQLTLDALSESDRQMVGIGKEVLSQVRAYLPRGPFNNYGGLPKKVIDQQRHPKTGQHSPAWWNQVVDASAEKALTQLKQKYPNVPEFKLAAACLAWATCEVGGGVCSKMATVTAAVLMEKLPPGSQIAQVFHNADHEFCIAKLPGDDSHWFVVDPWCHEPDVLPFTESDCYFGPEGVKNYFTITVEKNPPHGEPFGLNVDDGVNWKGIVQESMNTVKNVAKDMSKVFGQTLNVCVDENDDPTVDIHPDFRCVGPSDWG